MADKKNMALDDKELDNVAGGVIGPKVPAVEDPAIDPRNELRIKNMKTMFGDENSKK